jgi:hypothetical protein
MKNKSLASTQPVFVRAYQRLRDGKREFVRRHTRRPHTQMVLPFEKGSVERGDDAKED